MEKKQEFRLKTPDELSAMSHKERDAYFGDSLEHLKKLNKEIRERLNQNPSPPPSAPDASDVTISNFFRRKTKEELDALTFEQRKTYYTQLSEALLSAKKVFPEERS